MHRGGIGVGHLERGDERLLRLLGEVGGAAVAKKAPGRRAVGGEVEGRGIRAVHQRRRGAQAGQVHVRAAERHREAVGACERVVGNVAGGARLLAGHRQRRVREDLLAHLGHRRERRAGGNRRVAAVAAAAGGEKRGAQERGAKASEAGPPPGSSPASIANNHRICNENDYRCHSHCNRKRSARLARGGRAVVYGARRTTSACALRADLCVLFHARRDGASTMRRVAH